MNSSFEHIKCEDTYAILYQLSHKNVPDCNNTIRHCLLFCVSYLRNAFSCHRRHRDISRTQRPQTIFPSMQAPYLCSRFASSFARPRIGAAIRMISTNTDGLDVKFGPFPVTKQVSSHSCFSPSGGRHGFDGRRNPRVNFKQRESHTDTELETKT
jgi:hypothetical protein